MLGRIASRLLILHVLAIVSLLPARAQGQAGVSLHIPEADYIVDKRCDVLVATVTEVSKHAATREHPPVVKLKIDKILRGKPPKAEECHWEWPYHPTINFSDTRNPPPLSKEEIRRRRKYADEPIATPKVGSKWIILGEAVDFDETHLYYATYKYPYSQKKLKWAKSELKRWKRLLEERQQYLRTWPEYPGFPTAMLRKEGRPVDAQTTLTPSQPILFSITPKATATLWRCRVVELLEDDRVRVRRHEYDSRWDITASREQLILYPKSLYPKKSPSRLKVFRNRYSLEKISNFTSVADLVLVGRVSKVPSSYRSELFYYTFAINKVLKGATKTDQVMIGFPLDTAVILEPRDKSYILFLRGIDQDSKSQPTPVHKRITQGDGLVEYDDETLKAVQLGITTNRKPEK